MALEIHQDGPRSYKMAKRMWLTADRSRLVEEGDPEAAFFYAGEGNQVSEEDARRFGLIDADAPVESGEADAKHEAKPAATKAVAKPAATKAEHGPKSKK